jgi:uroporphyrinogen III methyltransferase/synthase
MGVKTLARTVKRFIDAGKKPDLPVALIESGCTARERIVVADLGTIVAAAKHVSIHSPAIFVVGETVRLVKKLRHEKRRSLRGLRILVPRPAHQAVALVGMLYEQGAIPYPFPLIEIKPPVNYGVVDTAIKYIDAYDCIVFTSANGVVAFMERLFRARCDSRALAHCTVCAIGSATAEVLRQWGIRADILPEKYTSEEIVKALGRRRLIRGKSFLLPRSSLAGRELPAALRSRGGTCKEVTAYRTCLSRDGMSRLRHLMREGLIDVVLLTSPSIVEAYRAVLKSLRGKKFTRPRCIAIGPVTADYARKNRIKLLSVAEKHSNTGLVQALSRFV